MSHWCGQYNVRGGWENFLLRTVKADLEESMKNTPIDLNNLNPHPAPKQNTVDAVRDYADYTDEVIAGN